MVVNCRSSKSVDDGERYDCWSLKGSIVWQGGTSCVSFQRNQSKVLYTNTGNGILHVIDDICKEDGIIGRTLK
jgi:hypothetical protein